VDRNGDQPPRGDFSYHEEHPQFGQPHEDNRQFPPRQRPDERGQQPEMERLGPTGPEREHFGQPGPEMGRFGQPPHGGGSSGLPSLLDIKVPRMQPGVKRGAENVDGNFHGGEQFGPPPEKMPPNYGSGNDMWPEENPIPPPRGPGRGAPPFRGGPGRGVPGGPGRRMPRGRGMRGVRGR